MTTPKPGDRVRVTYETEVESAATVPYFPGQSFATRSDVSAYSAEVIEAAVHPSRDEVGSIRSGLCGTLPLIKVGPDQWVQLTKGEEGIEVVIDDDMAPSFAGRELLGVVPDSPAAKAVEPKVRYFAPVDEGYLPRRLNADGSIDLKTRQGWESERESICANRQFSVAELEDSSLWREVDSLD